MEISQFQPNSFSEPTNYTPLPSKGNGKSSANKVLFILICLLTLVLAGLIVFLIKKQQLQMGKFENPAPTTIIPSPTTTTIKPSPTTSPDVADENELKNIDVGTDEADFNDIQTDVGGL